MINHLYFRRRMSDSHLDIFAGTECAFLTLETVLSKYAFAITCSSNANIGRAEQAKGAKFIYGCHCNCRR